MFSIAVVGLIFSILFSSYNGIVNALLRAGGLISTNIGWFSDKKTAMFVIILVSLWTTFGLNMIYFLMGLQNIPKSLYECAEIDGANTFQKFFYITLPLVAPILQLVLMLSVLGTIKMTDLILVLTNGAPGGTTEVVMTYIFKYFFSYGDNAARDVQFGYASAMAVITAVILGIITLVYLRVSRKMQELSRETLISFTMALPIQSFLTMQQHLTCRLQSGSECGEKALSTTQRHAVPVMWVWNRL